MTNNGVEAKGTSDKFTWAHIIVTAPLNWLNQPHVTISNAAGAPEKVSSRPLHMLGCVLLSRPTRANAAAHVLTRRSMAAPHTMACEEEGRGLGAEREIYRTKGHLVG